MCKHREVSFPQMVNHKSTHRDSPEIARNTPPTYNRNEIYPQIWVPRTPASSSSLHRSSWKKQIGYMGAIRSSSDMHLFSEDSGRVHLTWLWNYWKQTRESNVKVKSDLTAGDITYYKNESIKHTWGAGIITFIDNTWFTRGQIPIT